jgi:hypothetical protein
MSETGRWIVAGWWIVVACCSKVSCRSATSASFPMASVRGVTGGSPSPGHRRVPRSQAGSQPRRLALHVHGCSAGACAHVSSLGCAILSEAGHKAYRYAVSRKKPQFAGVSRRLRRRWYECWYNGWYFCERQAPVRSASPPLFSPSRQRRRYGPACPKVTLEVARAGPCRRGTRPGRRLPARVGPRPGAVASFDDWIACSLHSMPASYIADVLPR